jgi:hypothetical protein
MATLSAHGSTVLARAKDADVEYVLRSDGTVLRRIFYTSGGASGYSTYAKKIGTETFRGWAERRNLAYTVS